MAAFTSKTDIGNRALQHCGADRIASFTEDSKRASEVSFVYDKVRVAELQENVWTFATRRATLRAVDTSTMLLVPALWTQGITYYRGSIVADQSNNLWISNIPNNVDNDPLLTSFWEPYFGPLTVSSYSSSETYGAGELVYTYVGDGTYRVYLSMQDANSDNPATATSWSATVTYAKDQVVTYLSVAYKSLFDLNLSQQPNLTPSAWAGATTYASGNTVVASDGYIYRSLINGNAGFDPTVDNGTHWVIVGPSPWTTSFVGGTGSIKWLEIGGVDFPSGVSLAVPNIVYPLGSGPSSQSNSQNIFKLPAGYLRIAPQNPKVAVPMLGGPTGNTYNDWQIENGYIMSSEDGSIRLRFVADVTDVTKMDDLFCEGLAARIGLEVAQPITQSDARLQTIASLYKRFMDRAKTANAIEAGYDDPPDDVYVSVRL